MKKSTKIIIVIAIIVVLLIIALVGLFLVLNNKKEFITSEEFKNIMEQKGFIVVDANSQFPETQELKQVYVAVDSSYSYKIEFYELTDEASAKLFYNNNKTIIENSKGSVSAGNSFSASNYAKYTMFSNGQYAVISRIDNTVIYSVVNDVYKDKVQEILKEIGY